MSRRRSTLSPDEMGDRNIEMAARPSTVSRQARDDARATQVFSGFYPTEAAELARAARCVRRIAPDHAPELLEALDLVADGEGQ